MININLTIEVKEKQNASDSNRYLKKNSSLYNDQKRHTQFYDPNKFR